MIPAVTASEYIYSKLGSNASLLPLAVKDLANSTGLTAGSYITGKDVEGKDRFIDEFGTEAIWLGGIPFFKKFTDLTFYKLLGIDPKFDVRNLKNKDILAKAIEKAPTEEIKQSIIKASKNPKYTKNLAIAKFAFSTLAAIVTYAGLTKFRQHYRLEKAKEELKEKAKNKQPETKTSNLMQQKVPQAFAPVHPSKNGKNISFSGSLQDFMFNPVKNLMILDGSITAERLASSQSQQELINYTIKEGGTWFFMYFAGSMIQKYLENKAKVPIKLDSMIIESKELKQAFKDNSIKTSLDDYAKIIKDDAKEIDIYNFIHENPDNFIVKMAKKSKLIKTMKNSEKIDTRAYIDIMDFKKLKSDIEELYKKAPKENIENYLKQVVKSKRIAVLKNIGICIGALGVAVPALMIAMRYILPNNREYKVMEIAKKANQQEKSLSKTA